jgi:hypothetical protein
LSVIAQFTATPNRIFAAYKFVKQVRSPGISQEELERLFASRNRSDEKKEGSSIAQGVIAESIALGLLVRSDDRKITARDLDDQVDNPAFVEALMLGLSDIETTNQDEFPYALAWTLSQPTSEEIPWRADLRGRITGQTGNDDDFGIGLFANWQQFAYWARYLGFVEFSPTGVIVNPAIALRRHLDNVFNVSKSMQIRQFVEVLAESCPVFDGGQFRREIVAMKEKNGLTGSETTISHSISLALRTLEHASEIKLENQSDADALLFPDWTGVGDGSPITHISRNGGD